MFKIKICIDLPEDTISSTQEEHTTIDGIIDKLKELNYPVDKIVRTKNDTPIDYINIDNAIRYVVGIVRVFEKKSTNYKDYIMVDDYGTKPLYEIRGNKAVWRGGLSSTAQLRFFKTKEDVEFNYRWIKYKRIALTDRNRIYDNTKKYTYSTD